MPLNRVSNNEKTCEFIDKKLFFCCCGGQDVMMCLRKLKFAMIFVVLLLDYLVKCATVENLDFAVLWESLSGILKIFELL